MHRKSLLSVTTLIVAATAVLSGCGSSDNGTTNTVSSSSPTASSKPSINLGKYDPPVELSYVGTLAANIKFDDGDTYEKNGVTAMYEKDLGIKLVKSWTVDAGQYAQKVALSISSGEMPDLMRVPVGELQQMVDSGMLADLTDVYAKYTTEATKKFMTSDGGKQLESAKFGGKLMAIPATDSPFNAAQFIYIRNDWLTKLGLQPPKTMSDLLAIAEAFTTKDPDGNGKNDSYAFASMKEVYNAQYGFLGLFYGYHAYPGAWIKDSSGKLVNGSTLPEMKAALKVLQELYAKGQIDKELFTKDHGKANELVSTDKVGMTFGTFSAPGFPLQAAVIKDKKLTQDWSVFPLVSSNSAKANNVVGLGVTNYYVVSKKAKNPEAVMKLLNRWIEVDNKPITDDTRFYKFGKQNQGYWQLNPLVLAPQNLNSETGGVLSKAITAKDPTPLKDNPSGTQLYQDTMDYLNGVQDKWASWMKSRTGGSLEIMYQYGQNKQYVYNEFYGAPTPTMVTKKAILDQREQEMITKIVTGGSLDEFDKFVADWKSLGGEQITKEVNEWFAKRK
ncbi:extracellular solute-binding protein [Paenibacillus koleovorans]|uniref:extracellular solute-binding protein n=1 Tax=Paenibacillus koleovorans TaxID=121608 RepID=UPI000FD72118|nr:extracellular solute-binding protein [Paenibacillus koleovorans]